MSLGIGREPQGDGIDRWLYGVALPIPIAGVGLMRIATRHADLRDPRSGVILHGSDAVALGTVALLLALLLHFHFFWGLSGDLALRRHYRVLETLTALALLGGLLYVTWCLVRLFIL